MPKFCWAIFVFQKFKNIMKAHKIFFVKKKTKKGKWSQTKQKEKERSSFKNTKIECFNYGRVRHDYWLS